MSGHSHSQPISLNEQQQQRKQQQQQQVISFPTKNGVRQRVTSPQSTRNNNQLTPRPPMKPVAIKQQQQASPSSPTPTTTTSSPAHQFEVRLSNSPSTISLSHYPQNHHSRRDTLRSLSDILNTSTSSSNLDSSNSTHADFQFTSVSNEPSSYLNHSVSNTKPLPDRSASRSSFRSEMEDDDDHQKFLRSLSSSPTSHHSPTRTSSLLLNDPSASEPTPKPKSNPKTKSYLLDLDISGSGPSLKPTSSRGGTHEDEESEEEEDSEDDHQPRGNIIEQPSIRTSSRQIIMATSEEGGAGEEEEDPYSSSNDDDDEDDAISIQYTGSSCDDHGPPNRLAAPHAPHQESISEQLLPSPTESPGPYMNRQLSASLSAAAAAPSSANNQKQSGMSHGLSTKKSFSFFKQLSSHSRASSSTNSHSENQQQQQAGMIYNIRGGSTSSFKPDHSSIDPSPVSSLTSFNTTGSKASTSSKASSSSRMARLLSRVTGGGSSSNSSSSANNISTIAQTGQANTGRPQLPKSASAQQVHSPGTVIGCLSTKDNQTAKPMRRKGSISNFLDTISISRDKSSNKPLQTQPVVQQQQQQGEGGRDSFSQPSIAPRKSFDMLMRPFLGSRNNNQASNDPVPSSTTTTTNTTTTLPSLPAPNPATNNPTRRPMLKAKRSYDMLKGKLGSSRKSMDDLSNMAPPPPTSKQPASTTTSPPGSLPSSTATGSNSITNLQSSQHSKTKKLVGGPILLSETSSTPTVTPPTSQQQFIGSSSTSAPNLSSTSSTPTHIVGSTAKPTSNNIQSPPRSSSNSFPDPFLASSITPASNGNNARTAPRRMPAQPRVISHNTAASQWNALESILVNFQSIIHSSSSSSTKQQQGSMNQENSRIDLTVGLTTHLLPFLKQEEVFNNGLNSVYDDPKLAIKHRSVLLGWLELIFDELREPQPTSRAACLDGVSGILESHFFASHNINSSPEAVKQYRLVLVSVLNFAIDKLNDKAVYANTLVFAGRMLSLAFFRIEGVGRKLLRALPPVKRMSMRRLLDEMESSSNNNQQNSNSIEPPNLQPFPAYLRELCFVDLPSYCKVFNSPSADSDNLLVQEGEILVEMSGNWLIRWTASDSDLPFAFYRAYHRQLATYLRPQESNVVHPSTLISMPGFLLVSASFLDKCDSLVHRSLRSVTTLGPTANNFNAGESANLVMGAKPKVLELAHRRLVSTALDIVGGSPSPLVDQELPSDDSDRRRQFFGGLLNLWIRAIAKRTSMWDTRSVFLLLDFLDGLFYTVLYTAPVPPVNNDLNSSLAPAVPKLVLPSLELFDLHFILDVLRRILLTADNTVCIMRTIAFIYSQFEALTSPPETLRALCLDLLLDPEVFQHLFLHWNSGVRGYYMRLLVWRLSRLNGSTQQGIKKTAKSKDVVKIILAFNARLDAIRKRHDQLSPASELMGTQEDEARRLKRTTICSTRGVSDKPWAISELPPEEVCTETMDDPFRDGSGLMGGGDDGSSSDKPAVAKVVSWLKVVKRLGGSSKPKNRQEYTSPEPAYPARLSSEPSQQPAQQQQQQQQMTSSQERSPEIERDHLSPARSIKRDRQEQQQQDSQSTTASPQVELSELENESVSGRKSESSQRSAPVHGPESPTFFQFEFELGAEIPRSDSFDTPATTPCPSEANPNNNPNPNSSPASPANNALGKSTDSNPHGKANPEPRVSSRFSKRASLLPPAALDMLKDNEGSEDGSPVPDVPTVPSQFIIPNNSAASATIEFEDEAARRKRKKREKLEREARLLSYPITKQAYAVKALAEYEQSLEEEFEWKEKLIEEHNLNLLNNNNNSSSHDDLGVDGSSSASNQAQPKDKESSLLAAAANSSITNSIVEAIVPRLAVSWPLSFSEDE
ncbi:hypothetical protein MJO29_012320 [Puccinia striiformis f. sp. tritici]|nr:hypothetical protein MJO29_012320 [Puccinia striiformis f. sp. tritici]